MAESHVISALRDKRAELSGLIRALEAKIGHHRVELVHLDATIRLFAPEMDPNAIQPRRPVVRNDWFAPGQCIRLIYDFLRDAPAPVATAEIARRLMESTGIPLGDERTRALVHKTVLGSLNRAGGGLEKQVIDGTVCWRAAA